MFGSIALAPLLAGEVTGTVKWEGKAPPPRAIKMNADAACHAKHDEPVMNQLLVLGEGQTMGDVIVRVVSGLPDKKWDPPAEAAVLDQHGCMYMPHVLCVMVDQDVKILNSDGILHNVNVSAKENRSFNLGMPAATKESVKSFSRAEADIRLKCNVHPWMSGVISVSPHPFFSVTGMDGKFTIKGLPPGTYEVEAWHHFEKIGSQKATVTIAADGDVVTHDFTFSK
jgi:plastocyanin